MTLTHQSIHQTSLLSISLLLLVLLLLFLLLVWSKPLCRALCLSQNILLLWWGTFHTSFAMMMVALGAGIAL